MSFRALFTAFATLLLFALALADQSFEPPNFNITEALAAYNVEISKLKYEPTSGDRGASSLTCGFACYSLARIFGSETVLSQDEAAFGNFTGGYWSQNQADVNPKCIFRAPDKRAVAVVVLISRLTQCRFAVKSGGHAAFAGASSIEGGITVSLQSLNAIKLSADRKTAAVGPGNTWSQVYAELAKFDLAVIGGRVQRIGVGGLTTGGGISFFSGVAGWACDNVAAYELLTATGRIITVSPHEYSDLYWALRGGGNNFGIVLTFHLNTIPLPNNELWGGSRVYTRPSFPALTTAFSNLVANAPSDGNAGQWVAFGQLNSTDFASVELWYAKPNGGSAPIFNEYNTITPGPFVDSTGNKTLVNYTSQLQQSNPYGLRETYYCITVKANEELAHAARDIFYEEVPSVSKVAGVNPILLYQGITVPQIRPMAKNGGNALGLSAADGPLYLISISCWWQNEVDDETVYTMTSNVLSRIKTEASKRNAANDYLYMNYASLYEDVIRSYGAENKARLKRIANKYDPQRVWQKLQPGYFKLDGPPVADARFFSG